MPVDQAVGEVVEALLRAYRNYDVQGVRAALSASVLARANAKARGLGNLHLTYAFARLLLQECPAAALDQHGVPRIDLLVGDGIELPGDLDARLALEEELGGSMSRADAKASLVRLPDAIPLTQMFIQRWVLCPQAIPAFVNAQLAHSPAIVDDVWGVLFQACANIRSTM